MNEKLLVHYKERPWLRKFANEIGDPATVKTMRLDHTSVLRQLGEYVTSKKVYTLRGYFFDECGECICPIGPKQTHGFFERLKRRWEALSIMYTKNFARNCSTIEDELRRCRERNNVRFVVIFGQDVWSRAHWMMCGQPELTIYKMPKGARADEFLAALDKQRAEDARNRLASIEQEVAKEFAEAE